MSDTRATTFIPGTPINYSVGRETFPPKPFRVATTIHGLTGDAVKSIDVEIPGGVEHAALGDHAFYWGSDHVVPIALIVTLGDGSILRYSVEGRPGRELTSARSR
jgi:hypothetical protein